MCELGLMLTLGSTVLAAGGQMQQAKAQANASRYQAKVTEMNMQLDERRARDAIERGAVDEQRKRQQVQQIQGQQLAAMSANGIDAGFGSPLDTLIDTATLGEMDALTLRSNAHRQAYDFRVGAENKKATAEMQRMSADNAETGGWLNAAGTVIGGLGSGWKQYKTSTSKIGSIA